MNDLPREDLGFLDITLSPQVSNHYWQSTFCGKWYRYFTNNYPFVSTIKEAIKKASRKQR